MDTVTIKLNDKKATCKMDNCYILLTFFNDDIVVNNCYYLLLFHIYCLKQKDYYHNRNKII